MVANESYDFAVALLFAGFGTVNPDNIQKYQQPWEYPRISTTQEYQQCTLFPVQCTGSFIFEHICICTKRLRGIKIPGGIKRRHTKNELKGEHKDPQETQKG